jgi:hypothetical protein
MTFKPSKKMGRPPEYNEEIAEEICERLSIGQTLSSICNLEGMPNYSTVWRWESSNENFRNKSAHARKIGTHALADDCIRIADDPMLDAAEKRVRIDTRLRLLGKWNARQYGDKIEIENTGVKPLSVTFTIGDRNAEPIDLIEGRDPQPVQQLIEPQIEATQEEDL